MVETLNVEEACKRKIDELALKYFPMLADETPQKYQIEFRNKLLALANDYVAWAVTAKLVKTAGENRLEKLFEEIKSSERENLVKLPTSLVASVQSGWLLGYADCYNKFRAALLVKIASEENTVG